MLEVTYSTQFKKDFKKARRLPLADLKALFHVISILENQENLEKRYKDHNLSGNWSGFRECHIQPDLLLI